MNFHPPKWLSALLLLLASAQSTFAQKGGYPVSDIPDELLENADVIIREQHIEWQINSMKEVVMQVTKVATIMNKDGAGYAAVYIPYDDFTKVTSASVKAFDKYGKSMGKVKGKAFMDVSNSGGDLASDDRIKFVDFSDFDEFPYTFRVNYEVKMKGLLSIPAWQPLRYRNMSVQHASLVIKCPNDYKIKYKERHIQTATDNPDYKKWEVKNLPAVDWEPYSSACWDKEQPRVLVAPLDFELGGYAGGTRSWKEFGAWSQAMLKDTKGLSEEDKAEVRALVTDDMSREQKVRAIYSYLQENTRYVSIQLGIGGWKPLDADFVHEKKYGDCKALSFYTKSMLEELGIPSIYTLVMAGEDAPPLDADFPSDQFNHVFLCIPNGQDSIWLECTSQTVPFGYLGDHTGGREVLLVGEESAVTHTPTLGKADNLVTKQVHIQLDASGDAKGRIEEGYHGLEYERVFGLIDAPERDKEDWLKYHLDISEFSINSLNIKQNNKGDDPALAKVEADIDIRKLGAKVGKRLFFRPVVVDRVAPPEWEVEGRKTGFGISSPYTKDTRFSYQLPEGYHVEKGVKTTEISSVFGDYSIKAEEVDGELRVTRMLSLNKGDFAASEFQAFTDFLTQVAKADKQKVALVMDKSP